MKKNYFVFAFLTMVFMLGTQGIAGDLLPAPTGLSCVVDGDTVFFDWTDVTVANKYSVDVDVPVNTDGKNKGRQNNPFSSTLCLFDLP